jgi:hypothetical protein
MFGGSPRYVKGIEQDGGTDAQGESVLDHRAWPVTASIVQAMDSVS